MEKKTEELDNVSKQIATRPYFVQFSYHNRLRMLDYKLDSKDKDPGYISTSIEGIVESVYKDLYGKVYLESYSDKQLPYERQKAKRNYETITQAINQFAGLSSMERYEYLKKVKPQANDMQMMSAVLNEHRQRS